MMSKKNSKLPQSSAAKENTRDGIKKFFKPNLQKILLAILFPVFFFVLSIFFSLGISINQNIFFLIQIVGGIIAAPFLLLSLSSKMGISLTLSFLDFPLILCLMILWFYILSCISIFLIEKISGLLIRITWSAKKISIVITVLLLGVALYGVFTYFEDISIGIEKRMTATADDNGATEEGVMHVVKANNMFALDLYSRLKQEENGNLFFSPWSISSAMVMTYEGARGQTADEMVSVLHFPKDNSLRRSSFAKITNGINKGSEKYILKTANALWLQKEYPFLEEYKKVVHTYYLGTIENIDFANPAAASSRINAWVSENTNDKIKQIVDANGFNQYTKAALTNAIYFKGKWVHPFKKSDTKPQDFTLDSGEITKVPMMSLKGKEDLYFKYMETEGLQMLELPYQGDEIAMLVLLPRGKIADLESILTEEKLHEWRSTMKSRKYITIKMPKYTFETSYSLKEYLQRLGMHAPFTDGVADFSGMDGTKQLFIDKVLHKAYVDVNEEGTEAAAATYVGMQLTSLSLHKYINFIADHPFLFIIQEKKTGNILFIGRVMDPRK
jgi:serpin B